MKPTFFLLIVLLTSCDPGPPAFAGPNEAAGAVFAQGFCNARRDGQSYDAAVTYGINELRFLDPQLKITSFDQQAADAVAELCPQLVP